jgi:hypothetical protein
MLRGLERRFSGRGVTAKPLIDARELLAVIGELPEHLLNPCDPFLVSIGHACRPRLPVPGWRLATSVPADIGGGEHPAGPISSAVDERTRNARAATVCLKSGQPDDNVRH